MKVAIIGITGLVGKKISWLLEKRQFPVNRLIGVASSLSEGKKHIYKHYTIDIVNIEKFMIDHIYNNSSEIIVFFATSNNVSGKWIPKILEHNKNAWIIDNSSEYRLHKNVPLVIPEINSHKITPKTRIIANPNCSTAQLVMVLYPLHIMYKIKRVVVSTYQSVSGAGYAGENQLSLERENSMKLEILDSKKIDRVFPTKIDMNCIAQCGDIDAISGYTSEEIKLERETPKILEDNIKITATAVRVPVTGGHSESVNIEFENSYNLENILDILKSTKGIQVKDMACPSDVYLEDNVWVSRIRKDYSNKNSINLWIVADNLMKGAALNAVQIAEHIIKSGYVIST
tara:strand:- start:5439 stop:6470 length:1032 start_codon:yes stop_codon:yes gene_type:complete